MRHFVLLSTLPISLACAGLSGGESDGVGHCAASEQAFFSCPTREGAVSLCGGPGELQLRAGPLGAPQDLVPASRDPAAFAAEERDYPQSSAKVVSISRGGWIYDIHVEVTGGSGDMGPEPSRAGDTRPGVMRARDNGDHSEYIDCGQPVVADWEGLLARLSGSGF